jgi:hypothetical protein
MEWLKGMVSVGSMGGCSGQTQNAPWPKVEVEIGFEGGCGGTDETGDQHKEERK